MSAHASVPVVVRFDPSGTDARVDTETSTDRLLEFDVRERLDAENTVAKIVVEWRTGAWRSVDFGTRVSLVLPNRTISLFVMSRTARAFGGVRVVEYELVSARRLLDEKKLAVVVVGDPAELKGTTEESS